MSDADCEQVHFRASFRLDNFLVILIGQTRSWLMGSAMLCDVLSTTADNALFMSAAGQY